MPAVGSPSSRRLLQGLAGMDCRKDEGGGPEVVLREESVLKDLTSSNVSKRISYTETITRLDAGGTDTENIVCTQLLPSSVSEILPKAKNVSCEYCAYTTNRRSHLNEHYRIIHLKVKVICDLCGKEFANINQVRR
jgi:hypothetical protein